MYNIINLQQNTPAWHAFRSCHLGGSDCPVICNISPWTSPEGLWGQKMGFIEPTIMTDRMKRGQELEPLVREYVNKLYGLDFQPIVLESKTHKYMSASLDGFSKTKKIILEIKCPNHMTHTRALSGKIPDYYNYQIQHCLESVKGEHCLYVSYNPECLDEYAFVDIYRDEKIIEHILDEEKYFWECMQTMTCPKPRKFDIVFE